MDYLLKKGNYYCVIRNGNRIEKTTSWLKATRFSGEIAREWLRKATHKLKGFQLVPEKQEIHEEPQRVFEGYRIVSSNEKTEERFVSSDPTKQLTRREILYNRQKGRCAICGQFMRLDDCNVDHIVPKSHGGSSDLHNLQAVHFSCNLMKADIPADEFSEKLSTTLLYQMGKDFDEGFYQKLRAMRFARQKKRFWKGLQKFGLRISHKIKRALP